MSYYGLTSGEMSATYVNGVQTAAVGGATSGGGSASTGTSNNQVTLPNGAQVVIDANGNIIGGDPTNSGMGVQNNAGAISQGPAGTPVSNPSTVPATTPPPTTNPVSTPTDATGSSGQSSNLTPAEQSTQTTSSTPATALSISGLTGTPPATSQTPNPNANLNAIGQGVSDVTQQVQQLEQDFPAILKSLQSSGATSPTTQGSATGAITSAATAITSANTPQTDPVVDANNALVSGYQNLPPALQMIYGLVQNITSPSATQQTFSQQYQSLLQSSGLQGLQTQYMNIENVINGTSNDIRNEITAAGGMATESEVQGMTTARNQTLILQANSLQSAISIAQDYVNNTMQFSEADQQQVNDSLNQKIGLVETAASMQQSIDSAAGANYNKTLTALGDNYTAFAATIPTSMQPYVEQTMGLASGTLSNPAMLSTMTSAALKQQTLQLDVEKEQIAAQNAQTAATNKLAQDEYYSTRSQQSEQVAAQDAVSQYTDNPSWTAYTNAQPAMSTISQALSNPGSVSDSDLITAYKQLVSQNSSITDQAAKSVSGGSSFLQQTEQLENYVTAQGGSLSQNQRDQIGTLSQAIYAGYTADYLPLYNEAVGVLNSQNLTTSILPTPGVLTPQTVGGSTGSQGNSGTVVSNGQTYVVGQVYNDGTGNYTIDANGVWTQQ